MICRVRFCGFTWRFAFLECTVTRTGIILYCIRISSAAFGQGPGPSRSLSFGATLFFSSVVHISAKRPGSRFLQGAAALAVIVCGFPWAPCCLGSILTWEQSSTAVSDFVELVSPDTHMATERSRNAHTRTNKHMNTQAVTDEGESRHQRKVPRQKNSAPHEQTQDEQ